MGRGTDPQTEPRLGPLPAAINGDYMLPMPIQNAQYQEHLHEQMARNLRMESAPPDRPTSGRVNTHINMDDVFQSQGKYLQNMEDFAPTIFRTCPLIINNRYAQFNGETIRFIISQQTASSKFATLIADDVVVQQIVGIKVDPFYVPATMLDAATIYGNRIDLTFPMMKGRAIGTYEFMGASDNFNAIKVHVNCTLASTTDGRYLITPVSAWMPLAYPIMLNDNTVEIGFVSPQVGNLALINPIVVGTVAAGTNPLTINFSTAPNLLVNDIVIIETTGLLINVLATGAAYAPLTTAYTVTNVVTALQIEIAALDGTNVTTNAAIQLYVPRYNIRIPVRLDTLDKKANVESSSRISLVNGGF